MSNALANSLSPYLIQHQDNPVNWLPWGPQAFEIAREREVPVFLSVGYAACHWCHVMAHESFENQEVGDYLNEHFVCVKVDREERPDVDQTYMNAVQLMTGHGGWPMSVFLDHEGQPFYAGTYWPLHPREGMPSFPQVLDALVDAWTNRRSEVRSHAADITQTLQELAIGAGDPAKNVPGADRVGVSVEGLLKSVDMQWGGFGSAPKFPHATDLDLMLRVGLRTGDHRLIDAAERTLDRMAAGGIRDHIGGGFARYSVDDRWLVPHFEKMLYDNGLLAEVYTRGFQVTGNQRHADVAIEILTYLQRDMVDSSGGIHCSEDADSEGVEGKFYVWQPAEVIAILGEDRGSRFCTIYNITDQGNFEGRSIANLPRSIDSWAEQASMEVAQLHRQLAIDREQLRVHRQSRVQPGRDDKIVVAWNALAIRAFAIAGVVFQRNDFVKTASRAADFILEQMRDADGNLLHVYRRGTSHLSAYIDDHALFADALITLYEMTADEKWLRRAVELAEAIVTRFSDSDQGGFFFTASDADALITRNKDWHDGSMVSGNAAAAMVLLKLSRLTDRDWLEHVDATLRCGETVIREQSRAASALIAVLDHYHHGQGELVIAAESIPQANDVAPRVFATYRPGTTIAWTIKVGQHDREGNGDRLLNQLLVQNKSTIDSKPTVYQCQNHHCESPQVIS